MAFARACNFQLLVVAPAGSVSGRVHLQVHVHDEDTLTINVSVERHEPEKDDPEAKYIRGAPHACLLA